MHIPRSFHIIFHIYDMRSDILSDPFEKEYTKSNSCFYGPFPPQSHTHTRYTISSHTSFDAAQLLVVVFLI